jgi:hypothetical protein
MFRIVEAEWPQYRRCQALSIGVLGGPGMGRLIGWREGQMGSVYKKPDKREDSSSQLEGAK